MPGAWEDSNNESFSADDIDMIYPEITAIKMRRPSRSPDFEMHDCPHEPQFGRYDTETGELDLCSCLDENGYECKKEDMNDDGSELENEDESINDSNQHEEEQKEEGVSKGEFEFSCGAEYYCLNCNRKYSVETSAT
ncbi:hypothetical protein BCON_0014g00500 [Botryotinia convoluta]|uniref:Uncharacterized protein n=1 Tax=Botryotinia convoluta TaxID=54673 RepID=A0A4Z1INW2_9HELO|nr:hypothetical protein BCON_0014g00500 [Botryotinia convoluta]